MSRGGRLASPSTRQPLSRRWRARLLPTIPLAPTTSAVFAMIASPWLVRRRYELRLAPIRGCRLPSPLVEPKNGRPSGYGQNFDFLAARPRDIAHRLPHQGPCDRRDEGDRAGLGIGLVLADDTVGLHPPVRAAEGHRAAEG